MTIISKEGDMQQVDIPPLFTFEQLYEAFVIILNAIPFWLKALFLFLLLTPFLEFIIDIIKEKKERNYLRSLNLPDLDSLSGEQFEKFLEVLFADLGYKVERTQYIGDFGADLIIERDGKKTVVQAKRYSGKVGVKAIQEVVAAKKYYGADRAAVVTTSSFTKQAIELAYKNYVQLIGRKKLKSLIEKAYASRTRSALDKEAARDSAEASEVINKLENETKNSHSASKQNAILVCSDCGKPVSEKVASYCKDHEKEFLGNIYCFDCQRKIRKYVLETENRIRSSKNEKETSM
jgi:restriction system protein